MIWSLGMFRSAGYARVFINLFPIIVIISAYAFENIKKINKYIFLFAGVISFILAGLSPSLYHIIFLCLSGILLIFIFVRNYFPLLKSLHTKTILIAIGFLVLIIFLHLPQDYSIEHKTVIETTNWISSSEYKDYTFYADSPSVIFFLNTDRFDEKGESKTSLNAKAGSILIWDTHFSKRALSEEEFLQKVTLLKTFSSKRVTINIGLVENDLEIQN